jgi:hypothetical protein
MGIEPNRIESNRNRNRETRIIQHAEATRFVGHENVVNVEENLSADTVELGEIEEDDI